MTGVQRTRPLEAMQEVIEAVRPLLSLEGPVPYQGQCVRMDNLYVDGGASKPHNVKIYIGGVGIKMLRLPGRIAGGLVLNNYQTAAAVRNGVEEIGKGAEPVGPVAGLHRASQVPAGASNSAQEQCLAGDQATLGTVPGTAAAH